MTVTIHPTLPAEAELLAEIQKAAFKPLYDRYRDEGNPYLRGPEDILCRLNRSYRQYTVEVNGETVGGILYRLHGKRSPADLLQEGEYYLGRVYIHPLTKTKASPPRPFGSVSRSFPMPRPTTWTFPPTWTRTADATKRSALPIRVRRPATPGSL